MGTSIFTHNQRGMALPLVLMLLMLLTVLGTAAWTASQSSLKQATAVGTNLQAEYLARSAVDATKEAWTEAWINDAATAPTYAHFYTHFDESNDEFVNVPSPAANNYDEIIETTLNYDPSTGVCRIEATAKVGSVSRRISAVSEDLIVIGENTTTLDPPWFMIEDEDYREGSTWKTRYWGTILGNPDSRETKRQNNQDITASYHVTDGTVNIAIPQNGTLYLSRYDNVIGYQAKTISFNCPLDLYSQTSSPWWDSTPYCLVLAGETIIFNHLLTIGDERRGNLTFHLPEGSGISGEIVYHNLAKTSDKSKVDLDAYYGLVKFSQVTINGSNQDESQIENKTFYFRHYDESDALMIGSKQSFIKDLTDSLGWTDPNTDMSLNTLISKGCLIEAPNEIKLDYGVLFTYE